MSTGIEKKPSIETQAHQRFLQVEAGIYRHKDKKGKSLTTNGLPSTEANVSLLGIQLHGAAQHQAGARGTRIS